MAGILLAVVFENLELLLLLLLSELTLAAAVVLFEFVLDQCVAAAAVEAKKFELFEKL